MNFPALTLPEGEEAGDEGPKRNLSYVSVRKFTTRSKRHTQFDCDVYPCVPSYGSRVTGPSRLDLDLPQKQPPRRIRPTPGLHRVAL